MEFGNQWSRREKSEKNSPSLAVGGAQEGCPAIGTPGKPKSLHTQVHSLTRAAHDPLPGVPDTQL